MKTPKSKLPWKQGPSYVGEIYSTSFSTETVCKHLYDEDTEYIIQACNNFPKAIQLLRDTKDYYNPSNTEMIDKFLKEIDEDI